MLRYTMNGEVKYITRLPNDTVPKGYTELKYDIPKINKNYYISLSPEHGSEVDGVWVPKPQLRTYRVGLRGGKVKVNLNDFTIPEYLVAFADVLTVNDDKDNVTAIPDLLYSAMITSLRLEETNQINTYVKELTAGGVNKSEWSDLYYASASILSGTFTDFQEKLISNEGVERGLDLVDIADRIVSKYEHYKLSISDIRRKGKKARNVLDRETYDSLCNTFLQATDILYVKK